MSTPKRFHALDIVLHTIPTRWWEIDKENMGYCKECAQMMRLRFEHPEENLYFVKEDPRRHLAKWNQVWVVEPRLEWVHIFIHTLGKVPTEWYVEIELRRGTSEWSALIDSFLLTFSFESGFANIGQALHNIQEVIFDSTNPIIECAPLAWDA